MNNFSYMGTNRKKDYFEGWYLRVTDDNNHSYVFIFGITLYEDDPHSFIQIIDSDEQKAYYFRFNVCDFYYNKKAIRIKDNILGIHQLKISIEPFDIDINIKPTTHLKRDGLCKCAMSFFRYLPLPTYHDIIFMKAKVEGTIKTSTQDYKINGSAYMEKNLGTKFPKQWLWVQTNHFDNSNSSLVLAKADLMGNCSGFFCILNIDGDEFRFATYNGFKINHSHDENTIKITMEKDDIYLIIKVKYESGCLIVAPISKAKMEREIEESLKSTLLLSLYRGNELIFHDTATNVGCENLYITDTNECKKTSS